MMKIYVFDPMAMGIDLDPTEFRPIPDVIMEEPKEEGA